MKKQIVIGIIILFILIAVSPMVFGYDSTDSEKDEYLDDLAFMLSDEFGNSKFEYFKEHLLNEIPDNDIVESGDVIASVESPSTSLSDGPMDSPWPMLSAMT